MKLNDLQADVVGAMKEKDEAKVLTLRMLVSAIKNQQIEKKEELTEEEVGAVVQKEIKKRRDSIEQYKAGGRDDLAQKEQAELTLLEGYVPAQMTDEDLETVVKEVIEQTGATSMQDMGKVIGAVVAKGKGLAGGKRISESVKKHLSS